MNNVIINGSLEQPAFIFAHGAGAGMEHPFMEFIAQYLEKKGICVIRFDFPYMIKQKELNKRRPPDRSPKLLEAYEAVIEKYARPDGIVIGGKSMGGRMASLLEDNKQVKAVACLGFPFHPPGKPENFKGKHLEMFRKKGLILQGERDTFGNRKELELMSLSDQITVRFLKDGDHSFKPRKASGLSEEQNLSEAAEMLATFILEAYRA
ncbi:alpha/beta family hydrolase [Vibrio salinus]|uniref:alpha/beta family hydrolase n=1 Tax=Vibrio salinus TaxID=2899784 RepID=UPI001E5119B1|nr:alpha/beta family hydrolase [Vibrio salinus]MCE0493051.1 alpha/beta fold hydrolase [Vibrio salinus]